jgi:hypothetical protein
MQSISHSSLKLSLSHSLYSLFLSSFFPHSHSLHAQHFRYLLQDPYCPRHGPRHSSLQCSRQASRAPRWYVPHIEFARYVFVELSQ